MKILYGVQGTGNGHLSRARAMAGAFQQFPELDVQWLFSGRAQESFFAMEAFGDYWWREGLTFAHKAGKIDQLATVRQLNLPRLLTDIRTLPVEDFDLVISDFEPVTAWAAKKQKRPSLGLGHQYAFDFSIPTPPFGWAARAIMKMFAPVQVGLGMHWHHFSQPILPPIAQTHEAAEQAADNDQDFVLVYLPFEHHAALLHQLAQIKQRFIVYGLPVDLPKADHITLKTPSVDGFRRDLAAAKAVICNSGFELIAETLTLGKPILTRPLQGQFEQEANALALQELRLARVVKHFDAVTISRWLAEHPRGVHINWPDVATAIAGWIADGRRDSPQQLAQSLWEGVMPALATAQQGTPQQAAKGKSGMRDIKGSETS
ncbi:MJ1255/VC2487 family glycosyltransferase [Microbulbifer sp. Q7]|uniref:MJ1255/VC2487 family glycosyltransferase n=1 Tax=Microbulbifer sp. Q7 TaxID=1785091 RepID=UPI0008321EA8|nr:MJ1255/VC2487 family glycosyltransferase [Microbulbifer sp. Q7]